MKSASLALWTSLCLVLTVGAERDLFQKKCRRECNTAGGTLDCWTATTDGFAYGLASAMVDYCQMILQLQQMADEKVSWYNASRDVLTSQVQKYQLTRKARQMSKRDAEETALSLLDRCFQTPPSTSLPQPPCPSCSKQEAKLIKQWSLLSVIPVCATLAVIVAIVVIQALRMKSSRRSYESIR